MTIAPDDRDFLWDVFLSHSAHDHARVRKLAERLRALGLRVWLDEWIIKPGDDIYAAIEHGLDYTRSLILCVSQAAMDSDWVSLERNTTIFRNPRTKDRRFIPLLLQDCRLPAAIQRLACVDWRSEDPTELTKLVELCRPPKKRTRPRRLGPQFIPPTGAVDAASPFYIKREADASVIAAAQRPSETVVVKASRQMGKSSLLLSYLASCRSSGKKTVFIDLASLFSQEDITNYSTVLAMIAQEIWDQLGQLPECAPPRIEHQRELIRYIGTSLLSVVRANVVIAFDEMDRLLGQHYQSDFFSMLRSWHDQRANHSTHWCKLGLAMAICTEPYLFISDAMRSPFNVGFTVELRNFSEDECERLGRIYGIRLGKRQLEQLMELLNGHPHLTHLALYALTGPNAMDFQTLLARAAERKGPFGEHLRALEYKLSDERGRNLIHAMREILINQRCLSRDVFYRLHGAGLIREHGAAVETANALYARFFSGIE